MVRLYLLEYGSGWFSKNADAGLSRIDFNAGNRPPVITAFNVNKSSGMLPLAIKATCNSQETLRMIKLPISGILVMALQRNNYSRSRSIPIPQQEIIKFR